MEQIKEYFEMTTEHPMPSLISGRRLTFVDNKNIFTPSFLFIAGPKKLNLKLKKSHKIESVEQLRSQLISYCLSHNTDSYQIHLDRLKGLDILNTMVATINRDLLNEAVITYIIWSALSCVHHFIVTIKIKTNWISWFRRKQAKQAVATFRNVLHFLTPTYYKTVFQSIMVFFDEGNLWGMEYMCANVLKRVFFMTEAENRESSLIKLINIVEYTTLTNSSLARQILRVIYNILEMQNWSWVDDELLTAFLKMYYMSLTPEGNHEYNYDCLEKTLETCIRAMTIYFSKERLLFMIIWMLKVICAEQISNENLLVFGGLLERVTNSYCKSGTHSIFPKNIPPLILKIISSKNVLYSSLGHRILHHLIDKNKNKLALDSPRVFLSRSKYRIVVANYDEVDKEMFQKYRNKLHHVFFEGLQVHGTHRTYLENTYTTMALFVVNIPCAYTAAAGVNFSMAIQEFALKSKSLQTVLCHQLHAIVGALLSLICLIHKASVFHDYVEKIIEYRAINAPHLNPPFRKRYNYAQHHILWNKPELFFEDWKTRYGLWRCFRTKRKDVFIAKKVVFDTSEQKKLNVLAQ